LAIAQHNLGVMYANGKGVAKNEAEAYKWYVKAAEQGLVRSQNEVGWMLDQGKGVPADQNAALVWFQKAANSGLDLAQYNLGVFLANGKGTQKDLVEAYKWFNLAASQGNTNAVNNRQFVLQQLKPEEVSEAQKRAAAFQADLDKRNKK